MKLEGGCYCGKVRYVAEGEPMMKAQCHCRECQYITGGSPNMFMLMPIAGFRYTKGTPRQFTRSDLERAVTREFCAECGTHLIDPAAGPARGDPESRHARRSRAFRRSADGDLHHRQAGFSIRSRKGCRLSSGCSPTQGKSPSLRRPGERGTHNHRCQLCGRLCHIVQIDRPRSMGPRVRGDDSWLRFVHHPPAQTSST